MLPKIIAQENLRFKTIISLGNDLVKKEDARKILSNWKKVAQGQGNKPKQKLTKEQYIAKLASMGIKVVTCQKN